eukprot:snap_masked-scaffold_14-processed-gene-5.28-mRNA-1 protein AED:1.00 eAED:1.00 QI:0/0/0/0/1/1/2/0/187
MKPVGVPLLNNDVDTLGEKLLEDKKLYQRIVGTLNHFATVFRPDLAFTSHYILKHLSKPTKTLSKNAKRTLGYLFQSKDEFLKIGGIKTKNNFATGDGRVSVTGECIFINDALICYNTKKQTIATESAIEAGHVGLTIAAKNTKFIALLLEELGVEFSIVVCSGCQEALRMVRDGNVAGRTKYIDVH